MSHFAIKKPGSRLWSGKYTHQQIVDLLAASQFHDQWLICPLGRADQGIEIRRYVQDIDIFKRMRQEEAAARAAEKALAATIEKPPALKWGARMGEWTAWYMLVGEAVVSIFFQHKVNQKFDFTTYAILIPFWTLAVVALATWIFGRVQHERQIKAAIVLYRREQAAPSTREVLNRYRLSVFVLNRQSVL